MTTVLNPASSSITQPAGALAPHRWVQVLSHIDAKYGGLSSAVPALTASISAEAAISTRIEAFCAQGETATPEGIEKDGINFWPVSRRAWTSPSLRRQFSNSICGANGVHIHGLWESSTAVAASTCRSLSIPYVLSAHGMLEPWALRSRHLKKVLYGFLVERRNVGGAACLHALTQNEAAQYRAFGGRSPIAVIPNGVTIPVNRSADLFLRRYPHLSGRRIVLFLARLHPKKGLDVLLQSWKEVASAWPEAHLVLAGPDCEGTQARLQAFIDAQQLQKSVTFTGMLRGDDKWSALCAAECFILPSHSEGLSVSVLEAMGVGCPVLLTEACNMPEVSENKAGWEVPTTSLAITDALNRIFQQSTLQNKATGMRGAELIERSYKWPIVARQMAEVYAWINGAPEPTSVQLEKV